MRISPKHQDVALLVVRLIVAAIFIQAAWAKFVFFSDAMGMTPSMVHLMQFLAVVEMLGGIAVLVGYLTRWAACGLGIIMVGAIFYLQFWMGMGFTTATGAGWNFPLAILAACVALKAFGPGAWSLDARRGGAKTDTVVA